MTSLSINQGLPVAHYRDFTQKCAKVGELKGWVRNTTCGRVSDLCRVFRRGAYWIFGSYQVEGEAQGSNEKVQKFLQCIDKGPSMAHVVKLEKCNLDVRDDEEGFAVMRTAESMFKPGN
ncbi:hypothetical protein PDIG_09370 [Penicillium digitatum PHI26]|uniref:acylphosphatase n=2 Tax=Penicillium digitatum TaxID=36651 RepID=K9GVH2_PEND2|nr:hypothetical protein PDIP_37430 [Penicillium digitatum Pd1]EKV16228.1 hypothetical protein PDIP_37430 [Penicillium digitatum Pd1]EKV18623.1 hypothetical protein PDIG_09370 [Penicillium digitatum PHI26]KAG0158263.1 hypothetical protein PDIDSM_5776 [Penicillium digitatum]